MTHSIHAPTTLNLNGDDYDVILEIEYDIDGGEVEYLGATVLQWTDLQYHDPAEPPQVDEATLTSEIDAAAGDYIMGNYDDLIAEARSAAGGSRADDRWGEH